MISLPFVEWFLAILFLGLPIPEDQLSKLEIFDTPGVRENLRQTALHLEIVDERELRWMLVSKNMPVDYEMQMPHMPPQARLYGGSPQSSFVDDLKVLRQRHKNLLGAPSLMDSERFPNRDYVNDCLAFNRDYRNHMDCQMGWSWDKDYYRTILRETDELYGIWDLVRDSRSEYFYCTVRRTALKELRERIGYDAYYRGELPPYVPTWRFRSISR